MKDFDYGKKVFQSEIFLSRVSLSKFYWLIDLYFPLVQLFSCQSNSLRLIGWGIDAILI